MPQILLSGMFPVFVVAFAVGALVFRLPARTQTLFALVAAPFVSYSLFMNVGLWVVAGNSITEAISRPFPWLIAAAVPLALLLALLLPGPRMRSDA
jgi:peptidoglycan/LPS O-acetylase OafA/YrhL